MAGPMGSCLMYCLADLLHSYILLDAEMSGREKNRSTLGAGKPSPARPGIRAKQDGHNWPHPKAVNPVHIVFDMDNTLVDELGQTVRPGIRGLLAELKANRHELTVWTSSAGERAGEILGRLGLAQYFSRVIAREEYDPANSGALKDVRSIGANWFIDDDPRHIAHAKKLRVKALLVPAYRRRVRLPEDDMAVMRKALLGR